MGPTASALYVCDPTARSEHCPSEKPRRPVLVTLHIYDVDCSSGMQALNRVLSMWGTGAFHAGVEVFGREWSFGSPGGIYTSVPRCCEEHHYFESVPMGHTTMVRKQFNKLIQVLQMEWRGCEYDVLTRNCCHFADELCKRITGNSVPNRIMSLAGAGAAIAGGAEKYLGLSGDDIALRERPMIQSISKSSYSSTSSQSGRHGDGVWKAITTHALQASQRQAG